MPYKARPVRIVQLGPNGFYDIALTPDAYAWFIHLRQRVRWAGWGFLDQVMPSASLHYCAVPRCPAKLGPGQRYCADHAAKKAAARPLEHPQGSAHSRGYGVIWRAFRLQFIQMLHDHQILPVCGASLPMGPKTHDSKCQDLGRLMRTGLHLDHEPPLEDWERQDIRRVCDPNRIQLLCSRDHAAKTLRERASHDG